jgi:glycosyltransferase involved in cell wall biosynthesis
LPYLRCARMMWTRLFKTLPRSTSVDRKLVVVGYDLTSHYFNELLGYKSAAGLLGLQFRIITARLVEPQLAAKLCAEPTIDPLPRAWDILPENLVEQLVAFADSDGHLASLWAAIAACDLRSTDMLLFPIPRPLIIVRVGEWLAQLPSHRRPSVFFRFTGGEIVRKKTGQTNSAAAVLFRLACSDLRRRSGQERVFLLADTVPLARMLTRVCCRSAFPMPVPKYHVASACLQSAPTPGNTVYVHLNRYSGRLIGELSQVIHRVAAAAPLIRFIINARALSCETRSALQTEMASQVEFVPEQHDTAEYFATISRSAVVLLAYEAQAYTVGSSGVFIEAASLGKVVVAPAATWMAEQMAAGRGVGTTFAESKAEPIVAALLQALGALRRLYPLACELAPEIRKANSSERYIEQMIALVRQKPDMHLIYQVGEEIDFSDALGSHCFMREGWGEIEDWGVWTISPHAELAFKFAGPQVLILRALVQPFLTKTHRQIDVHVSAGQRKVARWAFSIDSEAGDRPQWREALIRGIKGGRTLNISFAIDAPMSPFAEGISDDRRTLGLGLRKMLFRSL